MSVQDSQFEYPANGQDERSNISGPGEDPKLQLLIDALAGEDIDIQDKGYYYSAHCPFHQDDKPSFVIYKSGHRYHCYGCGKRGDAFDLIKDLKGLSFTDSLKYLKVDYQNCKVLLPQPKLIDTIAAEESRGIDIWKQYSALLKGMGWKKEA